MYPTVLFGIVPFGAIDCASFALFVGFASFWFRNLLIISLFLRALATNQYLQSSVLNHKQKWRRNAAEEKKESILDSEGYSLL
jgi:hypothetical protein